jgi:hypothetical protein
MKSADNYFDKHRQATPATGNPPDPWLNPETEISAPEIRDAA